MLVGLVDVGCAVDKIIVARGGFRAGGGPAAGYFFLLRQKEVTKKKATADAALRVPLMLAR